MSRTRKMETVNALASALAGIEDPNMRTVIETVMSAAEADALRVENVRSYHRNANRMVMLAITLVMIFTFAGILKMVAPGLMPLAPALALIPDFILAGYALIRKY